MRRIVSDTGPLLHLHEAACLALLEYAGTVAVPKAVDSEMIQHVQEWPTRKPRWITVTAVTAPYAVQATDWQQSGLLAAGEAEAIALALQLSAMWLLTDDTAARVFATTLGDFSKRTSLITMLKPGGSGCRTWATAGDAPIAFRLRASPAYQAQSPFDRPDD